MRLLQQLRELPTLFLTHRQKLWQTDCTAAVRAVRGCSRAAPNLGGHAPVVRLHKVDTLNNTTGRQAVTCRQAGGNSTCRQPTRALHDQQTTKPQTSQPNLQQQQQPGMQGYSLRPPTHAKQLTASFPLDYCCWCLL